MMLSISIYVLDAFAIIIFSTLLKRYLDTQKSSHGLPYPPGPKALPIIGNVLDIPKETPWVTYAAWARQYGDVISVTALGKVIVVVNSAKAAKEVFERRGMRCMDRPRVPILELMGWNVILALSPYSETWRVGRKLIDHSLRPQAALSYRPFQKVTTHAFLNQLLSEPEQFREHIKHFVGAIVMSLTYGYDVEAKDDLFVSLAEQVNGFAGASLLPGASLVNDLPFLRHFPSWLPGMGFKRRSRYISGLIQDMLDKPFDFVKESIQKGTAWPSIVRECIDLYQDGDTSQLDELAIKRTAVAVYAAGAETTVSAISSLFLVLVLYPPVQQRAQAELDAVLGGDRLPEYDDRPRLPFIDALCKEILRWRIVTPLGLPRAASEDNIYEGYFIPKGAMVLENSWAILHDPDVYPDPEVFNPDRFLTSDGQVKDDPTLGLVFGCGRRICPGRHLVDSTLWLIVASVCSAFNVGRGKDEHGNEIPVKPAYTDGLICHPKEFACSITPRCKIKAELIASSLASAEDGRSWDGVHSNYEATS